MDFVFSRRLMFAVAALFVLAIVSLDSVASTTTTLTQAMTICDNYNITNDFYNPAQGSKFPMKCTDYGLQGNGDGLVADADNTGAQTTLAQVWYNYVAPVVNPCDPSNVPTGRFPIDGKILAGYQIPENVTDPTTGAIVQCAVTVTPIGVPTWNPNRQTWETYSSTAASGNLASGVGATAVVDGTGAAVSPPPPVPPSPFTDNPSPPAICGGGSCYDTSANQYCASSGGAQFCVSGAVAQSAAGGCSGTDIVLCGGSPAAPSPNVQTSSISDPATQIQSSDSYTQANPTTGALLPVVVAVYSSGAAPAPTNGAKSTDSQPASASTAATPGSYSGGTDCKTPPACSGDAVACGAARTQWATTCQVHADLAGTSPAPSATSLANDGAYDTNSLWPTQATGATLGDAANAGNYDTTGLGGGTQCPMVDTSIPLWNGQSFTIPFGKLCTPGGWLAALVLGFAYFFAAKITAGVK
ncbi:MAG: virulence factor TspB C-terminal domain-related protein [Rhodanobacter sp.]